MALDEEKDRNDNIIRSQVDEISFLQSSLSKLSNYENLYNTLKKEYKEYEKKSSNDLSNKSNIILDHEKTIENLKRNLYKSEHMRSALESNLSSQIDELRLSNNEYKKQITKYKNEIDILNTQVLKHTNSNNKWEKAFINIESKVVKSEKENKSKIKILEKELLRFKESDEKNILKLDKINKFLDQVNNEIISMKEISNSTLILLPDDIKADLRAISRSLNRLISNSIDKAKQMPKVLKNIVQFMCDIINEIMVLEESKIQNSQDCYQKDKAIESSSITIGNLKKKLQLYESNIRNSNRIINKSNSILAEILQYCSTKSINRTINNIHSSSLSLDSPIFNIDESIIDHSELNIEGQHDDDSNVITQTKYVEDLQTYASALSIHCRLLSDEVERMKSNEICKNESYKDLQSQINEVINRYELQLQESNNLHEQELKNIWSKLRDSMERLEHLKLESDKAVKIAEENSEKTLEAYKEELSCRYIEKLSSYENKIQNYETMIEELKVSKSETEFDLERATLSLEHITFYFNHLLNSILSSSKQRDELIVQKRILLRSINGFSKLLKNLHITAMACLDSSTGDDDSLYLSSDGMPYKIASTDKSYDLEYNHMHINTIPVKSQKKAIPSLRVVTIVILATLRFANKHEQLATSDSLSSLPPSSSCKHMTSRMISDMIVLNALKGETLKQQSESDNLIFLSNFSEAKVKSPTNKVLQSISLIELIKKQKLDKKSSENVKKKEKVRSVCKTPIWYNLFGITDIYGLVRLETIRDTLLKMSKNLRESREREIDLHVKNLEKDNEIEKVQSRLHQAEKVYYEQRHVIDQLDSQQRENSKGVLKVIRQHLHNATSVEPEYHEELNHAESPEKRLLGIYENIGRLSQKQSNSHMSITGNAFKSLK